MSIQQNIRRLDPKRYRTNADVFNLVRAVFRGTETRRPLSKISSVQALRALGRRTNASVKPGDIVFFKRAAKVPILAVIKRATGDGAVIAVAPLRGQLRDIRINLKRRSTRRTGWRILNSFIRVKRPGDPPRTGYLAGQLVTQIRRYEGS